MASKKKPSSRREISELETSYRKAAQKRYNGKFSSKKKASAKGRTGAIVAICLTAVLVIGLVGGVYWFFRSGIGNRFADGFYVAGVNISGMSQTDAREAVEKATATTYSRQSMVIQIGSDTLELTPAVSGVRLDLDALMDAVNAHGSQSGEFDITPYLSVNKSAIEDVLQEYADSHQSQLTQPEWTLEGDAPDLTLEEPGEPQTLKITLGTPGCLIDTAMLYGSILQCYNRNVFQLTYDSGYTGPDAVDPERIAAEICQDPSDAVMDMETFEVSEHSFGYRFDLDEARTRIAQASFGETITLPMELVAPEHTHDELAGLLFRDVLGTYTAIQSSQKGRDTNLRLSCEAINGIVLMPGEVFSYDQTLGERTPEKGYEKAAGYVGMETVQTYGGGICQASSALYYCSLIADIEIVQRHSHTFISAYMPLGMDATVSWKGPDLKIRNTTDYPIRIEASAKGGTVVVSLIGTDTKDYYVKMEYEINDYQAYKTIYEEYTEDNEEGYQDGDVITTPYNGYTITTYKCKYSKATNELLSRTKEVRSVYERRDHVIARVTAPEPEPTDPDVPPTEDPSTPVTPPVIEEDG